MRNQIRVTVMELVEGNGRRVKTRRQEGVIIIRNALLRRGDPEKKSPEEEKGARERNKKAHASEADSKSDKSDKDGAAPASKAYAGSEHFVALRGYEHFVALRIKGGNTERASAQPDP